MTLYTVGGYKYRLEEDLVLQSSIFGYEIDLPFIKLTKEGVLTVKLGFASDGPSGPTLDLWWPRRFFRWLYKKFIMPSLGHDALYRLLRLELLPPWCRKNADQDLRTWCLDRLMKKTRADIIFTGVDTAAGFAANPDNKRKVYDAP